MMYKYYLIFFLSFLSLGLFAQQNREVTSQVDEILYPFTDEKPGYALAIIKDGKITHKYSKGLKNLDCGTPMKTTTVFNLGAISKQFVAVSVLHLVDKGDLLLDDKLGSLLDNIPAYAEEVTVRNLLKNQSFLPEYDPNDKIQSNDDIISFLNTEKSLQENKEGYSNLDYPLLVNVIEEVSGKSFSEYLHKYIFRKLDMDQSFVYGSSRLEDIVLPTLYRFEDEKFVEEKAQFYRELIGEQGVYSTVEDYAKFEKAYYTDIIIDCDLLYHIFPANISGSESGYGWVCMERDGFKYFWHGAGFEGTLATLVHYPEQKITLFFTTNNKSTGLPLKYAFQLAKIFDPSIKIW